MRLTAPKRMDKCSHCGSRNQSPMQLCHRQVPPGSSSSPNLVRSRSRAWWTARSSCASSRNSKKSSNASKPRSSTCSRKKRSANSTKKIQNSGNGKRKNDAARKMKSSSNSAQKNAKEKRNSSPSGRYYLHYAGHVQRRGVRPRETH